jgi:trigger factor
MKRILSITLILALCMGMFAACSAASSSSTASDSTSTGTTADVDFSKGLTEGGYLEGVNALEYVTLPEDYDHIPLPADVTTVSDETVQTQIDTILANFATAEQITDRAVEMDDVVNIDYVGRIDGEEFDGGSTNGYGTSVVAGGTNYIDDFLTQIIGHMPGETFDVEVTFPDPYESNTDLSGKDAVFEVTINYIEGELITPELTDDFVAENLTYYGWETVADMESGIRATYLSSQINNYVWDYLIDNSTITEVPQQAIDFAIQVQSNNITLQASQYSMSVADYMALMGSSATSLEEFFAQESQIETMKEQGKDLIVMWAVGEKANITVTEDDIKTVLSTDDLSTYESVYGMAYLKFATLYDLVYDYVVDNAVEA